MSRARELAKLGNPNIFTSDSEGVGIGTNDPKQDFQVGVGFTVSGSAGVATAQSFVGDCSGTTASFVNGTFTGNVSIAKTLNYDDVTNIDSVGLITARNGLQVLAGISTFSGQTNLTNTNVTAGIVTVAGQTLLANANVSAAEKNKPQFVSPVFVNAGAPAVPSDIETTPVAPIVVAVNACAATVLPDCAVKVLAVKVKSLAPAI